MVEKNVGIWYNVKNEDERCRQTDNGVSGKKRGKCGKCLMNQYQSAHMKKSCHKTDLAISNR